MNVARYPKQADQMQEPTVPHGRHFSNLVTGRLAPVTSHQCCNRALLLPAKARHIGVSQHVSPVLVVALEGHKHACLVEGRPPPQDGSVAILEVPLLPHLIEERERCLLHTKGLPRVNLKPAH